MSRRCLGGLICAISILLGASACSSDDNGPVSITTADAYSAAIRWYLESVDATPTPTTENSDALIVYLAPDTGTAIDSQAQASVVAEMADMQDDVTIRFADVRDDALKLELPEMPVKDNGVLLLVGAVAEGAPPVSFQVGVYRNIDDVHTFTMRITASGESFRVTAVSEVGQG